MNYDSKDTFSGARVYTRGLGKTLRATIAIKIHPIMLDLSINSATNAYTNVGQMFVLCASRYGKYLEFKRRCETLNGEIHDLSILEVEDSVRFAHSLSHARLKIDQSFLTIHDVAYLGCLAFSMKLSLDRSPAHSYFEKLLPTLKKKRTRVYGEESIDWNRIEVAIKMVLPKV